MKKQKTSSEAKTAVVILACKDYESLEISLPNYLENTSEDIHFFVLQNGRGTYDKERTFRVACRCRDLYPERLTVVDWIPEDKPYKAIQTLLHDPALKQYIYICKVDDDTFPVTPDWIDKLKHSYITHKNKYGDKLAFTFPLVNNNPWGFMKTVEFLGLKDEYDSSVGRIHYGGTEWNLPAAQKYFPLKVYKKNEIFPSGFGTVWRYPYMARWIHEKTTLDVDSWVKKLRGKPDIVFDNTIRYSINCMFFEKNYWDLLDNGTNDDESTVHETAIKNDLKLIACQSIPFVHLFFFSQRDENKDLLEIIRSYYQKRLNINYPIAVTSDKNYELENRIRYLEDYITNYLTWQTNYFKRLKNIPKWKRERFIFKLIALCSFGSLKNKAKKRAKQLKQKINSTKEVK